MTSTNQKIVFIHIPKTAGLYIKSILYMSGLRIYPKHIGDSESDYNIENIKDFDIISGHWDFEIINLLGNVASFTILRDPVDRCISHYNYMATCNDCYNKKYFDKIQNFKDPELFWSDHDVLLQHSNVMTKIIAGYMWSKPLQNDADLLQTAKENLSRFTCIGIYDKLGLFISNLCDMLNIDEKIVSRERINCAKVKVTITNKTKSKLIDANRLDNELYEYAISKLV